MTIKGVNHHSGGAHGYIDTVSQLTRTGLFSSTGNQMFVDSQGSINVVQAVSPDVKGIYSYCLVDALGVAATTNHMSIGNPVGNTKIVSVVAVFISSYSVGGISGGSSIEMKRSTVATGGTLKTAADISKLSTGYPDPSAVIRTGNVSTVLGATHLAASPPPANHTANAAQIFLAQNPSQASHLLPGDAFTFYTASGDTNQRWNLVVAWAEV